MGAEFAKVNENKCVGCGGCIDNCPVEAIEMVDGLAFVNKDKCVGCGACAGVCPVEAIEMVDGLTSVNKDKCVDCGACVGVYPIKEKKKRKKILPIIFGSLLVGGAVAATSVAVSKCSNKDDATQTKDIVIVVTDGTTYNIPYTDENAKMLLAENDLIPSGARTTTFTNDQGLEFIVNNAEITQFVLGKDFADAYGDTLPDKFMKDFFAFSTQTTIDCDISVLNDNIINAGDYCFMNMFYGCINLTTLPEGFNLPQGLKSVGDYFALYMFCECTNLETLPKRFNLPQNLESIGGYFAYYMFNDCTELITLPEWFNLPPNINTVGEYFAGYMFFGCESLETLPDGFNLPQNLKSVESYFAHSMFYECTNLETLPEGFNLPQGLESVGDYFAVAMFYNCTELITLPKGFNLPQNLEFVGSNFAHSMFYECTNLETLPEGFKLPQKFTSVGTYFASHMFNNCTSLRSPSNYDTIIQIPKNDFNATRFCYRMFFGITGNITSTPVDAVDVDGTPDPESKIKFI